MSYPSLEQYNEAFQHPDFSLIDPALRKGSIATTGIGLPLALCGGFALTYTLTSGANKFAVRCFHKQSNALERRYRAISRRLKSLQSRYFVDFEFQPQGVKVAGQDYPIVKMAWATGVTLGEFLERRHRYPADLQQLGLSLRGLAQFLEGHRMAHGDIQPGNVMVADGGKTIQLIDYDGIFVDDLHALGSAELGHRNFQHPHRTGACWDASLDRFSFIGLDLALRALQAHPELWVKTQSDGDAILFKANDFADPQGSAVFADLFGRPRVAEEAKNFAAICQAAFEKIPTLEDFLARKNIPQISVSFIQNALGTATQYLSAFPVLDAISYANCLSHVGDKVELIGKIGAVKDINLHHQRPYCFINFGPWRGQSVKLNIWTEGLNALAEAPSQSWIGKWISVVGLIQPPYVNKTHKTSSLGINITHANQIHFITEQAAKFRLSGSATRSSGAGFETASPAQRQDSPCAPARAPPRRVTPPVLSPAPPRAATPSNPAVARAAVTSNQAILIKMKASQPSPPIPSAPLVRPALTPTCVPAPRSTQKPPANNHCFIATAVYGGDAPETKALRAWRDRCLMPNRVGRALIAAYYRISPSLARRLERQGWRRRIVKALLDKFVAVVTRP